MFVPLLKIISGIVQSNTGRKAAFLYISGAHEICTFPEVV